MDDAGWNSTNTAWQMAKDDGILTQVLLFEFVHSQSFRFFSFQCQSATERNMMD